MKPVSAILASTTLAVKLALALLCAGAVAFAATPALAASSASSAASDSVGASVGSLSGSLTTSSESSSTRDVAQGEYRIVHIATANGRPDHLQLSLQRVLPADAAQDEPTSPSAETLLLTLPQAAFASSGLGLGQRVAATQRSYGIEFARASDRQAFFLVLEDHWLKELAARPVTL